MNPRYTGDSKTDAKGTTVSAEEMAFLAIPVAAKNEDDETQGFDCIGSFYYVKVDSADWNVVYLDS